MVSKVYVVGCGMGNPATLTLEAHNAIAASGLLVGAPRLLEAYKETKAHKIEAIEPEKIAAALHDSHETTASVLMSGDIGFYSGATKLYALLEDFETETIPGISSLVYLCSKLHTTWNDAYIVSAHGREHNALGAIQSHAKTFVLTGGTTRIQDLCASLTERGLGSCTVHAGENLSYETERIVSGTASHLAHENFDGLAVMLVENPHPIQPHVAAPHLRDEQFTRGEAPMTKEEVRELAICKLQIAPHHVVWDIGAGTGSVSIEAARAAYEGQVFAIEKNPSAYELLNANKDTFGLVNLTPVLGNAPEALNKLPAPDRVFIGGSSGQLRAILSCALKANPHLRACISAITLETLTETLQCLQELPLCEPDIVQLSFAKARAVGTYHMMMGANPIYLISVCGAEDRKEQTETPAGK